GWGGIHPVGASPALASTASWPTKDIAYSLALFPDGTGGYVMDGWGGLHPVGGAPTMESGVYWPHWIGAREIVLAPWSSHPSPAGWCSRRGGTDCSCRVTRSTTRGASIRLVALRQ